MKIFNPVNPLPKCRVDFNFDGSPFCKNKCFDYRGQCFEDLRGGNGKLDDGFEFEFRIVLSDDDYDYVESESLNAQLRRAAR